MSKSKHTPGPWRAQPREGFEGQWEVVSTCKTGRLIAAAAPHIDGDPDEANARLIAAAPELLKALVDLMRVMPVLPEAAKTIRGIEQQYDAANRAARAAIAKAKGETP
jgi:hypothetical protein